MAAFQPRKRQFVVAMRAQHGVLLAPGPPLRSTPGSQFERVCSQGDPARRYLRAILVGQRRAIRDYHLTPAVDEPPPDRTWWLITHRPGTMKQTVGTTYGLRTWID